MEIPVAAAENGVFTSPEIAKSFDFSSEERIYNWYIILWIVELELVVYCAKEWLLWFGFGESGLLLVRSIAPALIGPLLVDGVTSRQAYSRCA